MKLSQQSLSAIEKAIQKAVNKYAGLPEQSIVTDIHLQPNQNSGDLIIFDDEDKELACITVREKTGHKERARLRSGWYNTPILI